MGGHNRYRGPYRGERRGPDLSDQWSHGARQGRRLPKPVLWLAALVGLVLWTLLAWLAYVVADPVLGWIAASAGVLTDGAKGVAAVTGVGREVGALIDTINVTGITGQVIAWLAIVLKPAIVVVWAIGALVLIVAPLILPGLVRRFGRY